MAFDMFIPMLPGRESAKADFAISGATSVAGRTRPTKRDNINQPSIPFFRVAQQASPLIMDAALQTLISSCAQANC